MEDLRADVRLSRKVNMLFGLTDLAHIRRERKKIIEVANGNNIPKSIWSRFSQLKEPGISAEAQRGMV